MKSSIQTLLLGAGFGAAFLIGQCFPRSGNEAMVEAQGGRGPVNTPPNPAPLPPEQPDPTDPANQPIVYTEEGGVSASGNGFLAVTGSYGVGTSVLYLIDTESRQLAVYEARGGAAAQRRIVLVGARRIDLDLQLHGYNDRSEYEYSDLQKLFDKRGTKDRSVRSGLEPGPQSGK